MSEIPAKQAREITNNHEEWACELWYSKFKSDLFQQIQTTALQGINYTTIEHVEWNESKKKYLQNKLNTLGYKVTNIDDESITIRW